MKSRPGRRELACAALGLLLLAGAYRRLRPALAHAEGLLSETHLELAHGLLAAAHPARLDPAYRLPLGPLLEWAVAGAPAAGLLASLLATGLLAAAAGALLAGPAGLLAGPLAVFLQAGLPMPDGAFKMLFFAPLTLLPALALALRARRPGAAADWLAGLAFAPSLLYRSTLAFLPPLLALWTLARGRDGRAARSAARLLLPCAVAVLPWLWMTRAVHGRATPFERGASDMLVVGGALGMVDTTPEGDRRLLAPDAPEGHGVLGWAARRVAADPAAYAASVLRRLVFALDLSPLLLLLAGAGFWRARRDPAAGALGVVALYFFGVHSLLATLAYYYDPVWPLLGALAMGLLAPPGRLAPESAPRRLLLCLLVPALAAATVAAAQAVRYGLRASALAPASAAAAAAAAARRPGDARLAARVERLELARRGDVAGLALHLGRHRRPGPDGELDLLLASAAAPGPAGADALARAAALWRERQRLTEARDERERAWQDALRAGADASLGRRAQEVFEGFAPEAWVPAFTRSALAAAPAAARLPLLSLPPALACPGLAALARAAPSARSQTDLGVCRFQTGQPAAARAAFERALALDPADEDARRSLEALRASATRGD